VLVFVALWLVSVFFHPHSHCLYFSLSTLAYRFPPKGSKVAATPATLSALSLLWKLQNMSHEMPLRPPSEESQETKMQVQELVGCKYVLFSSASRFSLMPIQIGKQESGTGITFLF
jgi:hypothetical protein